MLLLVEISNIAMHCAFSLIPLSVSFSDFDYYLSYFCVHAWCCFSFLFCPNMVQGFVNLVTCRLLILVFL